MELKLVHLAMTLDVPDGVDAPRADLMAALTFDFPFASGNHVLDLGCGAGVYALAALKAGCDVLATDVSADAVVATRANAARNGLNTAKLTCALGDLFAAIPPGFTFDVIVANLPQTPCPESLQMSPGFRAAKWAGPDGLSYLRALFMQFAPFLRANGCLLMLQIGWLDWPRIDRDLRAQGYASTELGRGLRQFTWQEYESYAPELSRYLQRCIELGNAQPIETVVDAAGVAQLFFPARWVIYRAITAAPGDSAA